MDDSPINPSASVVERIDNLLGNKFRSDLTFIIEDDKSEIPAHKLIIALASPVFDRIVYGLDTKFSPSDVIKVRGITRDAFMQILRHVYTDKIEINEDNVFEILEKSNFFGLAAIVTECVNYLEDILDISTAAWIFHQLFHLYSSTELMNKCLQYIQMQPMDFFACQYFNKLSVDELKYILRINPIDCNEADLFAAMVKLAKAHCIAKGIEVNAANQRKILDGAEQLLQLESLIENDFAFGCVELKKDFYAIIETEKFRANMGSASSKPKRKWYTYQDAVWSKIASESVKPASSFHYGSGQFIYRRCEKGEDPIVSNDFTEILTSEDFATTSGNMHIEVLCGSGYKWVKYTNGIVPPNAVSMSQTTEPLFIARGKSSSGKRVVGRVYLNGRMRIRNDGSSKRRQDLRNSPTVSGRDNIDEFYDYLTEFDILVACNVKNPYRGNDVPGDAIFLGLNHKNQKTYLGRAWFEGHLLPAKVMSPLNGFDVFMPYGQEPQIIEFECSSWVVDESHTLERAAKEPRMSTYTGDDFDYVRLDTGTYKWEKVDMNVHEDIPETAVLIGHVREGENVYFGRTMYKGEYVYGTVHEAFMSVCLFHVSRANAKLRFYKFELLVHS